MTRHFPGNIGPDQKPLDTRRVARKSLSPLGLASQSARVLALINRRGPRATAEEVCLEISVRMSSTTARVNELAGRGYILDSGLRRPTTSGRLAVVWIAAAASSTVVRPAPGATDGDNRAVASSARAAVAVMPSAAPACRHTLNWQDPGRHLARCRGRAESFAAFAKSFLDTKHRSPRDESHRGHRRAGRLRFAPLRVH